MTSVSLSMYTQERFSGDTPEPPAGDFAPCTPFKQVLALSFRKRISTRGYEWNRENSAWKCESMTGRKQSVAYFETPPHLLYRYRCAVPHSSHYLQHRVDKRRSGSNVPRPRRIVVPRLREILHRDTQ